MDTCYLSHFQSLPARYQLNQTDAIQGLIKLRLQIKPRPDSWDLEIIENRVKRFGLANAKIETRGSEIADFQAEGGGFFRNGEIPTLEARMAFFKSRTTEVMKEFYKDEKQKPNDLIHVTCTGYTAPNAAHEIAAIWSQSEDHLARVTLAYHMGCYAALPAIRIGQGFCLSTARENFKNQGSEYRVDIVHQELCSLHFDPLSLEPEQIVVQSLFADGHIRYELTPHLSEDGFSVKALHEEILPDSLELMSWTPSSSHFTMGLSREVPNIIKPALKRFLSRLLEKAKIKLSDQTIFAIHPGGPKIIDSVQSELNLDRTQTEESHEILKHFGNMSSATLPHIWQKILKNPKRNNESHVVSLAFGPGLTLSGGVFQLCRI